MNISKPKLENPCKKFIDFKGDKGQFFFYDKEKDVQIEIPMPIYFIVLDELSTISGYNKKNDCGIYSNEVHSTVKEILRVKTFKGGESIAGLYNDIKDSVKALGGKYTKSVYSLLIKEDGNNELVNFKFRGSSFSGWLEKKFNTNNSVVGIVDLIEEVNGKTTYKVPVFKAFKMKDELRQEAILMDEILQGYLDEYNNQMPEKEIAKAEAVEEITSNQEWQGSAKQAIVNKAKEQINNEDDLPF